MAYLLMQQRILANKAKLISLLSSCFRVNIAREESMKASFVIIIAVVLGSAQSQQESCLSHAAQTCKSGSNEWTDGSICNAIYGNIGGNKQNLQRLMADHLKQSFQFLSMHAYFGSDVSNRMGLSKTMLDYSNKMWDNAQKVMHFLLHRGSSAMDIEPTLKLRGVEPFDTNGEVKALAHTLTVLKGNAENIMAVHKHANNKKEHQPSNDDSYDPMVMHFLEEELLEDYYADIRVVSGQLNVLGRMAKDDNTRAMGLHLFDESL